jgi:hypothetical protein
VLRGSSNHFFNVLYKRGVNGTYQESCPLGVLELNTFLKQLASPEVV